MENPTSNGGNAETIENSTLDQISVSNKFLECQEVTWFIKRFFSERDFRD